jgi:hypothetical protein
MRLSGLLFSVASGLEKFIDRILCACGALVFSQAPEFMQQYLQRLGGRLDEALRHLDEVRSVALQSGVSISTEGKALDAGSAGVAQLLRLSSERFDSLQAAESSLRNASIFTRPFVFLKNCDWETARSTLNVYKPAVPTTIEGLSYALLGMAVALGFYYFTIRPLIIRWYTHWRLRHAPPVI